jgi:uncharacterized protein YbjT (DUF2867 family)
MQHLMPTILVLGATGRAGRHFVSLALSAGHKVKAFTRDPKKMNINHANLEIIAGSILTYKNFDKLLDNVVAWLCRCSEMPHFNAGEK